MRINDTWSITIKNIECHFNILYLFNWNSQSNIIFGSPLFFLSSFWLRLWCLSDCFWGHLKLLYPQKYLIKINLSSFLNWKNKSFPLFFIIFTKRIFRRSFVETVIRLKSIKLKNKKKDYNQAIIFLKYLFCYLYSISHFLLNLVNHWKV